MLKRDLMKIPLLIIALFILSLGIVLLKQSGVGLDPWGVFHEGLNKVTGIPFGKTIELVGYVILLFSLLIKIFPGIGTILNIFLVGKFIDLLLKSNWFQTSEQLWMQLLYFAGGFVILSFGRALYISCNLGAGPRDGLFVGLVRFTKIDVKYVKPAIEVIVFTIGIIFGGTFGVGTLVLMFTSGYAFEFFFKLLKYDPKTTTNSNIFTYFKKSN